MEDWKSIIDDNDKTTECDDFDDAHPVGNTNNDEDWSGMGQVNNIVPKCMYINK